MNDIESTQIDSSQLIHPELLGEIRVFEDFLYQIGFKRIDGSIFGLLSLSNRDLCSEEIEQVLALSQSAVSQSVKNLIFFGLIEIKEDRVRRVKTYHAKADSMQIVASVFRKREQVLVENFKQMATRSIQYADNNSELKTRMQNIIYTCEIAESVMQFVIEISHLGKKEIYAELADKLPKVMSMALTTATPLINAKENIKQKFNQQLKKYTGEFYE